MIGQTISHFEIVDKLGEGGMGVVYKARDTHLDRFVAIKVLPPEKVANPERKRRFVQEAKSASALNHPHIVTIYDIDEVDGVDFIAMEYVAGRTLDALIPRKGMRLGDVLKYAVQIADALAAAHEAGIVHRDLKPGNVIVGDDGRVRLLDFGLAKLTEPSEAPELDATQTIKGPGSGPHTEEGAILGTVSYMSPEQAEGKKVDARSDIFSFGSLLYEMVTGQRAFQGESKLSTLSAILREKPKPLRELAPDTPAELERIVNRCLRADLARRAQHMADVRLALEELKEESDSGTLVSGAQNGRPQPAGARWTIGIAVAALTVMVVAAWIWIVRSPETAPATPLTAVPLTSSVGFEDSASFSPDGNQVAFSWNGENGDNFDIYVKLIGSPAPLRLTTDPAWDGKPAWSPDGRQIAFVRLSDEGPAVILVPAIGGPERVLASRDLRVARWNSRWPSISWFPDSRWLVIDGLTLVSTETGETLELTSNQGFFPDYSPAVSPGGRAIAFSRYTGASSWEIYLVELTGDLSPKGEPERLTLLEADSNSSAWTPDGAEVVFASGPFLGRKSLWKLGLRPRRRQTILGCR